MRLRKRINVNYIYVDTKGYAPYGPLGALDKRRGGEVSRPITLYFSFFGVLLSGGDFI